MRGFLAILILMVADPAAGNISLPADLQEIADRRDAAYADWRTADALDAATQLFAVTFERLGADDPRTWDAYFELGVVYQRTGHQWIARDILDRFLTKLHELERERGEKNPKLLARALERRLVLSKDLATFPNILDPAREYFDECIEVLTDSRLLDSDSHANCLQSWGNVVRRARRNDEAAKLYAEALLLRRILHPEGTLEIADNLVWLGHVHGRRGDHETKASLMEEAMEILENIGATDHPLYTTALTYTLDQAMARHDRDASEEIIARLKDSRARSRQFSVAFSNRTPPFHAMPNAEMLLIDGDGDAAWEQLVILPGLLSQGLAFASRGVAREELRRKRLELFDVSPPGQDFAEFTVDHVEWARRHAALLLYENELVVNRGDPSVRLREVQESLDPGDAMVGWVKFERWGDSTWGFVTRDHGPVHWFQLEELARQELRTYYDALLDASQWPTLISADTRLEDLQRTLGRCYWDPLEPALVGAERILLIPTSMTLSLPVESMLDSALQPLGSRYETAYPPSVITYVRQMQNGHESPRSALVVADPVFTPEQAAENEPNLTDSANTVVGHDVLRDVLNGAAGLEQLPRLPSSRLEAQAIVEAFSTTEVFRTTEASESRIIEYARRGRLLDYDIVHLATHALFDPADVNGGALAFTPEALVTPTESVNRAPRADHRGIRSTDGLLTAEEMRLSWLVDAELVTLSGCQTGVQNVMAREVSLGFLGPILTAGAKSLLMSRWKVHDHATFLLMQRFYGNLSGRRTGRPQSKSESLREARTWLRTLEADDGTTPYAHPIYWSAFYLVGDPR